MITDELKALVLADTAVAALLGTQLYDMVLPRGVDLPAAVYHIATTEAGYEFSGPSRLNEVTVQFDVYGDTPASAREVKAAIQKALDGFKGVLSDGTEVLRIFLGRELDMPFVPGINKTGLGFRLLFQVVISYLEASS